MSDERYSDTDAIDAALRLDGDPDRVKTFYEDWAASYDLDTANSDYSAPAIAAQLLGEHLAARGARLLDAGCGTGLVGARLAEMGYRSIDGFDLSDAMAELARDSGHYTDVKGGIDLMRAEASYPGAAYDAVLSIGVFTLGHVPPEGLSVLARMTRPGGLILLSTRVHYYDEGAFQPAVDRILAAGELRLRHTLWDAPYTDDGGAHYWLFER